MFCSLTLRAASIPSVLKNKDTTHPPTGGLGGRVRPLLPGRLSTSNVTAVAYTEQQGKRSVPLRTQLPGGKQHFQELPQPPRQQWAHSSARSTQQPVHRAGKRPGSARSQTLPTPPHLSSCLPQLACALALTSGVMDPQSWLMRASWCCSVFPCMMGLRVHISAMMQPPPQRSMGGP